MTYDSLMVQAAKEYLASIVLEGERIYCWEEETDTTDDDGSVTAVQDFAPPANGSSYWWRKTIEYQIKTLQVTEEDSVIITYRISTEHGSALHDDVSVEIEEVCAEFQMEQTESGEWLVIDEDFQ